ncbi:MAG: efflux transporter outer membrane subunit [Methylophilaceae bacterium]|nr:efflux transporter outer membrane subunit [Methylophilaceae bacterium]
MPKNKSIKINTLIVIASSALISSCTLLEYLKPNDFFQKKLKDTAPAPAWIAPLPHQGSLKALNAFWAQYQDPLLITLISAAEKESVDLATAKTRIMQARSNRAIANGALLPTLGATSSSSISVEQPTPKYKNKGGFNPIQSGGPTRSNQIGLQSAWELDLFGENAAELDASKANLLVAESSWHEARVALAAEVATSYFDYRYCNQQLGITKADAASRHETARLTDISAKAGFTDEGSGYVAQASDAAGQQQVLQQQASCDSTIKELVALTNIVEADLKQKMQQNNAPKLDEKTSAALFSISQIPAEVIAQRPDVYMAEQDVMAAIAELKSSKLNRYPTISLNGSIGLLHLSTKNYTSSGGVWSLGPLSISFPIFDGGKAQANIEAKSVKLDETFTSYRSKVRTAVKEVEQALVTLDSTEKRTQTAQVAATSYKAALASTEIKYQSGFTNIIELEDIRRTSLQADTNIVSLSKERNNAWISLYRAAGGGWTEAEASKPLAIKTDN